MIGPKRKPRILDVAPVRRRSFLRGVSMALAAPFIPAALRYAVGEELLGEARAAEFDNLMPTYFIEMNLRDQWDFGHVFVPPGLATHQGLRIGHDVDKCCLFHPSETLTQTANGMYLTPDSIALAPHVDDIAVMELNELCVGAIHGHEAMNAMRSPGRTKLTSSGKTPTWHNEPGYDEQGNDFFYSTTPTPASLHNFVQKQITPTLRNGITMKYISRFHTVCHFAGTRPEGELTRIQSVAQLYQSFPDTVQDFNVLPTPEEAELLADVVRRVDNRYFRDNGYRSEAQSKHETQLGEAAKLWHVGEPKLVSMPLTEEETAHWSAGVPPQVGANKKAEIWQMAAWAAKLLANDITRSVSLEFDYLDVHETREDHVMEYMGKQAALPLARLIDELKAAGIWERSVIAVYSLDGGRAPNGNSYGDEGKNTFVLAGGRVAGGYYGDVSVVSDTASGHVYGYHVPNDAGVPQAPVTNNDGRVPGARSWRTVMKALGVPDSLCDEFPDVAGVQPLNYMLKA
jgi:hypothetical protein